MATISELEKMEFIAEVTKLQKDLSQQQQAKFLGLKFLTGHSLSKDEEPNVNTSDTVKF